MSKSNSFRVGKVSGYLRGQVWYLCYFEQGKRLRPRVGADRDAAKQLASQINGQLDSGAPSAMGFQTISIPALRASWLEHHEQVLRSSIQSINRFRTATDHLLQFLDRHPVRHVSQFHVSHAEEFVRYLRNVRVSPNGHPNSAKRPLMDKGVRFILECCRALLNYAARRRHLSPYADIQFAILRLDRIPVEMARPATLFTPDQERSFLNSCDDWQFPLFLTLMLTGLRPGELCHLLLPADLDLDAGILRVRNKPQLGWQVKTRSQRDVPLLSELIDVLKKHVCNRKTGPVFRRRQWAIQKCPFGSQINAESELKSRVAARESTEGCLVSRGDHQRMARRI